jgi:hypothetical protein
VDQGNYAGAEWPLGFFSFSIFHFPFSVRFLGRGSKAEWKIKNGKLKMQAKAPALPRF